MLLISTNEFQANLNSYRDQNSCLPLSGNIGINADKHRHKRKQR